MKSAPRPDQASSPDDTASLLGRCFSGLEYSAYRFPIVVWVLSMLLAGFSIFYTAKNLTFKTSRQDLIDPSLQFHVLYEKYRERFEDFDGMIVVVEGENPVAMKTFADTLAGRLKEHRQTFSQIYYRVPTEYFKDKGLLFLSEKEITELRSSLLDHQDFLERINGSPGLTTLLHSINQEISAGMVDSLMTDFLGTEEAEPEKEDEQDLSLLIALIRQMTAHVQKDAAIYRSPWGELFPKQDNELESEGYLVSDDGRLLFILLNPRETVNDFTGSKKAIEVIRGIIREVKAGFPQIQVGLTGGEVISSDEMYTTQADAQRASGYALIGVAILFILFYRGVVKPLLSVVTLLIAIAWAVGYTTWAVGHLNIISVVFTTILIGLGIDFGIHILCRYREERRQNRDVYTSLSNTLHRTGRGNFSGAITTAIAFGAMAFTNFVGIIELGIIAAGGILFCLIAMIWVLPALITLEERWLKPAYVLSEKVQAREFLLEKVYSRYPFIIFASLGLLFAAAWVSRDIAFDYNLLHMQARGTEAVAYEMKIIESAKRASWNAAITAESLEDARRKYRKLQQMPSVGRIESILSALPEAQDAKIRQISRLAPLVDDLEVEGEDEMFSLPALKSVMKKIRFKLQKKEKSGSRDDVFTASEELKRLQNALTEAGNSAGKRLAGFSTTLFADYRNKMQELKRVVHPAPVTLEGIPKELKRRFVSADGKYLLLIYPSINIWEREEMEKFLDEMRRIDPDVTGNAVHMFESSRLMIEGYIRGGLYALAAITIYIWLTFRKFKTTLLVLLPTLAGAIYTVGLMDLFGIQFNLANLVILPLILGIGVVDGIHIVHRYREVAQTGVNVISKSTGQAVVLTSLTTMIGFGSLMIADHQGVYSLGAVLTLGVGSCLFTSVTLLPALMKLAHAQGWKV